MSEVAALFWDVGGVVLSNGWDQSARAEAARRVPSARQAEHHARRDVELTVHRRECRDQQHRVEDRRRPRHREDVQDLDERTLFHDPSAGGTTVSSALQAMNEIIRERYRPADWNIYAAQASDGDNFYQDAELTGRLLTELILPVTQFFAYIEVGDPGPAGDSRSSLWQLYDRLRAGGASLSMRKVRDRSEIFPVFHGLFSRQQTNKEAVS